MKIIGIEKIGIYDKEIVDICERKILEKINLKPIEKDKNDQPIKLENKNLKEEIYNEF